ncbi:MAG: hypothetical protein COB20_14965 [SAR86 cluster bacterium]|uniref:Uncharacterized protein n=1 Tax=SAR86 cluster bacterium TaxID=2030880 RepID=A0A2A4WWF2_9GAMM|nr:MAG: hypothetical protein COB20_14965 [SAR86 cluster bacterium]
MKAFIGLSLTAIVLVSGFSYSEMQQSKLLTQQIADYARQNSQLLTQIESNSLQNLESSKALRSLQSELSNRDSQIAALSRQLDSMQQQVDPDYQQVESRIRQQLNREIQASNNTANSDPRLSVIKLLSELDPMAMGEIIALNSQYGEFIRGLDVSEEREEVIINALHNLIAEQNQMRSEVIQEMQADPQAADRGDLRRQMQAISSPEAQMEALSYDLSESELNAFNEFQKQRQNTYSPFFSRSTSSSSGFVNGPTFFGGEFIQGGSGQSGAIQIMPILPNN